MILQALNDYYARLRDRDHSFPRYGTAARPIDWILVLSEEGEIVETRPWRLDDGTRREMVLPFPAVQREKTAFRLIPKRTSHTAPYFLWDKTQYALGHDGKRACLEDFAAFRELQHHICLGISDNGLNAFKLFLDRWDPDSAPGLIPDWNNIAGSNVAFQLLGERQYFHEIESALKAWRAFVDSTSNPLRHRCMLTGIEAPLAKAHPPIRNMFKVNSSQKAESTLVGINADAAPAFASYGLGNMMSPPISEEAAFNYTTVLNDVLKPGSHQKVRIGDATTVFWTQRSTESEGFLGLVFSQNESQGDLNTLRLFLEAARDGKMPDQFQKEADVRCYVLGLSPNASRLSVRFWHVDTVDGMWRKIGQHFDDLRITKVYDNEPDFPPMWLLLKSTLTLKSDKDFYEAIAKKPNLSGEFMRSILTGGAYPRSLLLTVLGRIRAEQATKDQNGKPINNVTYTRAALIKACLVRNARLAGKTSEVTVSLDESSTNTAYRLGRLFAVLEKLQQEAINSPNATIRDRYFGSASATPRSVFPVLLRLAQHHSAKAEYGNVSDRRIAQILEGVSDFPAHLCLEDQGLFALGYYHQRTSLWTKKAAAPETNTTMEQ